MGDGTWFSGMNRRVLCKQQVYRDEEDVVEIADGVQEGPENEEWTGKHSL